MGQRQYFRIPDVSGGLNLDQSPVQVADNEAVEIQNLRLDRVGSLVSRRGYSRFLDVAAGAEILTLGRWSPPDAPHQYQILAALSDGSLQHVDLAYTPIFTGLTAASPGEFRGVADRAMYANGQDIPVLYDGTTAYQAGIDAPAVPVVALAGVAGGTLQELPYTYAFTLYDTTTLTESNPSPAATATPTVADGLCLRVTVPAGFARGDRVRIYRSYASGSVLMQIHEMNVGVTEWVDNGSTDPNPLLPLRYDRGRPPALEHIAYVKGYVFGSVGDTLYWSHAYHPEYWAPFDYTVVPFEGNDTIRALWAYQDSLIVFGRKNIVLVAGNGGTPNTGLGWSLNRADIESGAVNARSIAEIDGGLAYLDYTGLRTFPSAQPIVPKLDRIFAAMTLANIERASIAWVPEERSLWVALTNGIYTIHLPNRAISWYTLRTNQLLAGGRDGFSLPLFIDRLGLHANEYGGSDDLGEDISIVWRSKIFQLQNPEAVKFFRRIGAFASIGSASAVTVTIADKAAAHTVTLSAASAAAGAAWAEAADPAGTPPLWDAFVWAAEGVAYFIGALPAQTLFGHTVQVTVRALVSEATEIVTPFTFEFREVNRFLGQ
jgi:hypothetical protein